MDAALAALVIACSFVFPASAKQISCFHIDVTET